MTQLTENFTAEECACRCGQPNCGAPPMKMALMAKIQSLRSDWGRPMIVTSGSRCAAHNAAIGGAGGSQHLLGNAIDFHFDDPADTQTVAELAAKHGLGGIGTGIHLLHLDDRGYTARWEYAI